jgi:succinate dehydrogenase / fumarate reductase, cytochrome b subunit
MWLSNSSIGRKLVMSISGLFLILFLTFHMSMNIVAVVSEDGYNAICEFLGANWYALVGTMILALGFVVHIVYAFILTAQNRKARGNMSYEVTDRPKSVEWASQNMLVLGLIVLCGLLLHFSEFWYKMQFNEIAGIDPSVDPSDGVALIQATFKHAAIVVVYLVWFVAIWFHLTHGFWSALQTIGWNNKIWFERWKMIGKIWATVVCLGFALVVIVFYVKYGLCA